MKLRILTVGVALLAISSVAFAQVQNNVSRKTNHPQYKRTVLQRHGYTNAQWKAMLRERDRRRHMKSRHHSKSWYDAVKRAGHRRESDARRDREWRERMRRERERREAAERERRRHHRRHRHHEPDWKAMGKHDNGRHLGWYKGKGNPHRDQTIWDANHHDRRGGHTQTIWDAKHHGKGKDKDDHKHKGKGKGHGHGGD